MRRRKCVIVLAAVLAAGLLPVRMAVAADGPGPQPPSSGERWDDGPALAGGPVGELALLGPGDPPGPPRDGDDDRPPPPPRREPGPGGDHRPPGPPAIYGDAYMPMPFGHNGPPGPDRRQPVPPIIYGGLESMQKIDPELYKLLREDENLERQTRELVMQYRRAPSEQREKLKPQITELVNKHFDVRQQRRSLELKRLEDELQRLRETIDRRSKARKEIVEKRVSELIGREDELRF